MSNLTETLIAQREAGLISDRECRASLRRLSKQAQFNADYSDSLGSHKRWTNEAVAASRAIRAVGRHPLRGTLADSQDAREFYAAAVAL